MGQPNFWDSPERAQQTIQQLKPLNALLKPYEDLTTSGGDLQALAELAEEDGSLDPDLDSELRTMEQRLGDFEMQAMLSGPQDASNAYLKIQAGTGGTDACDWAQMLLRLYARWAEKHGYRVEIIDEMRLIVISATAGQIGPEDWLLRLDRPEHFLKSPNAAEKFRG